MVGASGQETWVTGSVAPVLASKSARSFREVQHDRRYTGSLELHGRRGSRIYPRSILVGETLRPRREG